MYYAPMMGQSAFESPGAHHRVAGRVDGLPSKCYVDGVPARAGSGQPAYASAGATPGGSSGFLGPARISCRAGHVAEAPAKRA